MSLIRILSGSASPTNQRNHRSHVQISIPKVLAIVLAFASLCSALAIDSRSISHGPISEIGKSPENHQISNADLHIEAKKPNHEVTSSISAPFQLSGTATPVASTATTAPTSSSTSPKSNSTSSVPAGAAFTGLPQPFDRPLGTNFTTTTCPALFSKIINDQAVRSCVPISLLLQGSLSFFDVESSDLALEKTIDISCNVISATCNDLLQSYAASVNSPSGCQQDLNEQNQEVQFLFNGLLSYLPVYNAACLTLSSTKISSSTNESENCFEAAVENEDNPADLLLYTLALGLSLPNGSSPTCSSCTQGVMSIFANAARNLTSPLSRNYVAAASLVNAGCGANFVNATFTPIPGSDNLSGAVRLTDLRKLTTSLLLTFALGLFMMT